MMRRIEAGRVSGTDAMLPVPMPAPSPEVALLVKGMAKMRKSVAALSMTNDPLTEMQERCEMLRQAKAISETAFGWPLLRLLVEILHEKFCREDPA